MPTVDALKLAVTRMVAAANVDAASWPFGDARHLCLDWESFWLMAGQGSVDVSDPNLTRTRANLLKFAESARRFRQALNETGHGDKRFGFYGIVPIDAYSTYLAYPGTAGDLLLRQAHALPEMAQVVSAVDFLTTTTFLPANPSAANWLHIEATLKLAREVGQGKPVYVLSWPQYAGASGYMDAATWTRQLDLARAYGSGVVLWGSHLMPGADRSWNSSAPWWQATLQWLQSNR